MDKAISNKKEVFTINCREIPETIYVETRFIPLAAAKQKKYDQLFYLINKNGQLELTHNKATFLAFKNCNKIPKATVSVSLPSLQATSVQKPAVVQQSNIPSTISTLPSQQLIRPVPIAKLNDNVIKTNAILNTVSLPRVNAIPISTAAEISVVNIPPNVTKSLEPTAIINSKRSFNDNMQQTEISAFNMKSVGIQCQLAEEAEDLETDWPTTVQEEPSDSTEIDNIEMAKENFLKFVQENSTQYKNSFRECLICGEVCKSNKYFYTHMAIHQGPKVLCFKCGFCFENDDLLRKHNCLKTKLSYQIHLKCPHYRCRVTAISKLELYDHLNEHDNYRPYKCTGCHKDYFTRQEFLRHIFLRAKCYTQAKRKRYCIYNLQEQRDRLCRVRVFTLHSFKKRTILVTKYLSRRASNYGQCKICSRLYTNKRVFKSHHAKCAGIFRKRLMRKSVSKRFQEFVLDKRLWENIDLSQEPLPLGILEDMLERSHDKTKTIKLRGPSPSQHIEGEIQHFNQTIHNSLITRCTKLITLELYGITLDFDQTTFKDFPRTLKRLVFNNCNIRVNSNKSLFAGIDTVLVNLEELAIENSSWFDPYYVMPLSKLPLLRYLSLKGCWQMQEFIPYGSIAARHGFKQLEILDLRDTPLNDSDLQCFNAVETLKEIYLQCPEEDNNTQMPSGATAATQSETTNNITKNSMLNCTSNSESDNKPSTSAAYVEDSNRSSENIIIAPLPTRSPSISDSESNTSVLTENPSTSSLCSPTSSKDNDTRTGDDTSSLNTTLNFNDNDSSSHSSSSSSPSCSQSSKTSSANNENNTESTPTTSSSSAGFGLSPNIVPLVGTNVPPRSRFLTRPDHIFYLDVRNRTSPNAVHFNVRDYNNIHVRLHNRALQNQQNQQNQQSPQPVIEQMMRHNLFWDIVNPLGRVFGVGGSDRLFGEENGAEYHLNLFPLSSSSRHQSRGTISDRGVCCFGRTRQPVQHGVIWIRFNNRPSENRFERFSVRDYKFVTDVSLQHLVQCSPHLVFLDVSGTSVTLEGLQRFKELKPECKVVAEHLVGITNV